MLTSASTSPANRRDSVSAVADAAEHSLCASYQNWSGFVLRVPAATESVAFALDPSPDVALPNEPLVIAITHGHPEHVRGTLVHLKRSERAAVTVLASKYVCRYLQRRSANAQDRFMPVAAGEHVEVHGWRVRVFAWDHMALLPPSLFGALAHLAKLFRHPLRLARIARQSLGGPRHSPMLGFHLTAPESGTTLVYYGEGLHRRTTHAELQRALGEPPAQVLLAGVEPEDEEELPALIASSGCHRVVLFEPHKGWREQFHLPQVDMPRLLEQLREAGVHAEAPPPATDLTLCG